MSVRTVVDAVVPAVLLTFACAFNASPTAAAAPNDSTNTIDQAQTDERMVAGYLEQIGVPVDSLPALIFITSGGSADSRCVDVNGDETQHDRAFDYCSTDNAVYIGEDTFRDSYLRYRAAGPLSGLAHEYGHFLQSIAGVRNPGGATDTIRNENQADCFSGAFFGHLHERAEIADPADVESVKQYLTATASAEAPGRDHGTARERVESFELGYRDTLTACNQFNPATPLIR